MTKSNREMTEKKKMVAMSPEHIQSNDTEISKTTKNF